VSEQRTDDGAPLAPLVGVEEVRRRLEAIFPDEFPDRRILVGLMAARVIFVFLYGGFVEGSGRFLRPSFVYLFTEDQSRKFLADERRAWLSNAGRQGFRPAGRRWYADTSREPIRDDLMRNQLSRLGIMRKRPGEAHTASTPINYLTSDFAGLFHPELTGGALEAAIFAWRSGHLDSATLRRMALKAQGIEPKRGDFLVDLPDGSRMRISAGPSSLIAKDVIEQYARRHLTEPALIWMSASDKKALPQYVEIAASVGLRFDLGSELPDLILADLSPPVRFVFCEIVATGGPVTEARRQSLMRIVDQSDVPRKNVEFLTAYEDRHSAAFRKTFSQLALNSLVWFRTEPDLLVLLTLAKRREMAL
jgi:hypothetical protein